METEIEHDYRYEWPKVVTSQSLIFIMLGHLGETHRDGIPVKFIILFDFDIIDVKILYLRKESCQRFYSQWVYAVLEVAKCKCFFILSNYALKKDDMMQSKRESVS